jgi:hypothetical protein
MIEFPALPDVPAAQTASGSAVARFEDISQDGRLMLTSTFVLGAPMLWADMLLKLPLSRALYRQGILPIFSRMVVEGFPGPFGMVAPFSVKGGYQLAHAGRGDKVERIMLNIWAELHGQRARPRPAGAGEVVSAGRFFVEQVLTRPFAAPDQRKVLRLLVPGFPEVPEARHPFREHAAIAALPDGAVPLEPAPSPDVVPIVFGLCHTDSNKHVNSLVYPRMFEEAALRRFASLGVPAGLARFFEVGFRKPCFAGDRVRILLQAFRLGERVGAAGIFVGEDDVNAATLSRPASAVRMLFEL